MAVDELLLRVGEWAPTKPWIPLVFGVVMMAPVVEHLLSGGDGLLDLWVATDKEGRFSAWREGLSVGGARVIALGVAGALVASLALFPRFAASAVERRARSHARRTLRVFSPASDGDDDAKRTSLEGKVRLATVECTSPLGEAPCVVFGLRGAVDGCSIDDADGGDFDVELETGERVFVSLEHAVLRAERAMEPVVAARGAELDDFLDTRGVVSTRSACDLDEIILCDGDSVRVEGMLSGTAAIALAYRGGGSRVVSGDERAPLVVNATKRHRL